MRKLFTIDHNTNGKGPVYFGWNKGGNLLAVCGSSRQLCIYDRQGKPVDQKTLSNPGSCIGLDWDCTGETLAVIQHASTVVILWHNSGRKLEPLETGLRDLSFLKWNKNGPHLAVGTIKGNLLLFNKKTLKKLTSMGKHTKRISCGCWSTTGKLCLGGEDKALTVSNTDGDSIDQTQLKTEPINVQFARMKTDHKGDQDATISVNLGGKTLLLYEPGSTSSDPPMELAFLPKYGSIVSHKWFGDGYILIGFSSGHVVVISTHVKEIYQEISFVATHNEALTDITYCAALQKGASIGDNTVQVIDMTEITHLKAREADKYDLENEYGALQRVEWTEDGQILTVSSKNGNIHTFLTKIPVMHDSFDTKVLYLTSLRELCVRDVSKQIDIAHIAVEIEPTFLCLGPEHAAVGMNNCVWFYSLVNNPDRDLGSANKSRKAPKIAKIVSQRSYVSSVQYVKLSTEHAAVMSDGKVTLHLVAQEDATDGSYGYEQDEKKQLRVFPEKEGGDNKITCVEMTERFMTYGTNQGTIVYFSLEDWTIISEYRNTIGIRSLYPNPAGTRLAFIDDTNEGYIYSPVDDSICNIENFGMDTDKILWDTSEWGVFIASEAKHFVTYVYAPHTRWGPKCTPVTKYQSDRPSGEVDKMVTDKPAGFTPILVRAGGVVCQMSSNGTMPVVSLNTHTHLNQLTVKGSGEYTQQAFQNALGLNRLDAAWVYASQLDSPDCWYALGDKALNLLEVQMAIRVYRIVQQPAMVLALDKLVHINEKALLLGHVSMLFKNFNDAQAHFMRSSNPMMALEMRRDLMHWDLALELSEKLSPQSIPHISREYASQLEFRGEHQQALEMYNRGLVSVSESDSEKKMSELYQHNVQCHSGIARITIRMGDIARGFQIAMESDSPTMAIECAQIFEELKQWTEAAQLFEKASDFDKAAQIYICQTKNLKAAATLMPHITSHKIQGLFGGAKEKEGSYEEAKQAYIVAQDWDNVVRLSVEHLGDISSAYEIVRKTKSAEAAALVAKHCRKDGNPATAIEFLLLAKKTQEAFEMASSHDHMHTVCHFLSYHHHHHHPSQYATVLGTNGSSEDYNNVAQYYDKKGDFTSVCEKGCHFFSLSLIQAGDYYFKCKKYEKALQKFLESVKVVEEGIQKTDEAVETEKRIDDNINKAIAVVGEAQSEKLNKTLVTYLTSDENDSSNPNYPKYLFSLYMALGKYEKGCGMAIVIARREQNMGHYRIAHRLLYQTYKQLEKHGIGIPSELRWNLMLLHSYLIAKPLMKTLNDHEMAARMLVRVSKNISKFPQHTVAILTSCVTECNKAGFDKSAYHYARELVTSDRKEIPEKHRKKMDTIVRKPGFYSKDYSPSKKMTVCSSFPKNICISLRIWINTSSFLLRAFPSNVFPRAGKIQN